MTAELDVGDGTLVLFDTGGGSSQFTFGHGREVDERFSVDVGAARFTERFGLDHAVRRRDRRGARRDRRGARAPRRPRRARRAWSASAAPSRTWPRSSTGSPSTTRTKIRGTGLDHAEIDRQIELYRGKNADERRAIPGLQPGRAEVILAGALIVRTILEKLGSDSFTVSDRGLRHGLLAERF